VQRDAAGLLQLGVDRAQHGTLRQQQRPPRGDAVLGADLAAHSRRLAALACERTYL